MSDIRFSVVVPTHNRYTLLRQCLRALHEQTYPPHEIIVVDDASTDETPDALPREFPNVRYVRLPTQQGPSVARNTGIRMAEGDVIAFTDDDCRVPPDWLAQLANAFLAHPDAAGVGGYQEAPDDVLRTNIFAQVERIKRSRRWKGREKTPQKGGFEVPGFGTNNAAYRREVLLTIGGFDETFTYAAGEDTDLRWRICEAGYTLVYIPLKVEHYRTFSYTLHSLWHQYTHRGFGQYEFEMKRGRAPSFRRLVARAIKRTLAFWRDMCSLGFRKAAIIYLQGIANVWGQYRAWKEYHQRKHS